MLRSKFFPPEQVEAITRDYRSAGLDPVDVAVMAFAEKIALHAYKVTPGDIDELRRHGLSDTDILDVALTAAARCLFSKLLDAIGAEPDAEYLDLEDSLRQALTVGRPFGP
ncbi:MAG: carboxymuconolactone decarboxylase family protein [Anaerolineales bacterium]